VLLERNIFTRNNIEKITGYYPAAVKIFNQCYRVTCNDNLVIDHPFSNGIWYDVGNVDGVFTNNWLEDVGFTDRELQTGSPWPCENAFFVEISKGAICTGNVFVNCDYGIFLLNSSDVKMYNNTFVNSTVTIGRDDRDAEGDHFDWHPATGPGVDERDGHEFVNNLLTGNENYIRPLLFTWQKDFLCDQLSDPMVKSLDHNVYMRTFHRDDVPLILWSPAENEKCRVGFNSPDEVSKVYSGFSKNSLYFFNNEPLFKSYDLSNFTLLPGFPGLKAAKKIPAEIAKLTGNEAENEQYIGAYPSSP
jgi:parallel beta-helix repeat protein